MMVVSVLPTTAFAVDGGDALDQGKVRARKSLVYGEDGELVEDENGYYTIRLSVEGKPVKTGKKADVVLCIDVSNSMADPYGWVVKPNESCDGKIYKLWEDQSEWWEWHSKWVHVGWKCQRCGETWLKAEGANDPGKVHKTDASEGVDRLDIAKAAAQKFAEELLGAGMDIRLAVVAFGGYNGGVNDQYLSVKELTNDADEIKSFVSGLTTPYKTDEELGGTNYTAALAKADNILKDSNSEKYILFLSDGVPGYYSNWDYTEDENWNGTVQSEALQDSGVTIYTGGIAIEDTASGPLKSISSYRNGVPLYKGITQNKMAEDLDDLMKIVKEEAFLAAGTNAVMVDVINTEEFDYDVSGLADNDAVAFNKKTATITWNIGKITEAAKVIEFKVKPKEGASGTLHTNTDVSLTYLPAGASETVIIPEKDIGDPTVTLEAPSATTVTVTFDANGGAWDEAVKDYTMGTENKTASKDVAIGSKLVAIDTEPVRSDFTFKGWYTDAQCTEEVNFNYAYAYSAVTLYADWAPATPNTVNYTVRQHYINAQGEDALAVNVINASAAAGTKIVNLISSMEQDYNDDSNDIHYIYVQANTKLNSAALIRETAVLSANDVIDLYYYQDIWNDDKDATNEGDNIPDMYQAVVKFMPGDPWGTVTGDGTTQVFTLKNDDGKNATSGTVTPDMTNVIVTANEGFAFDIWTKDKDETAVQPVQAWTVSGGDTITFYAHFDTDVIGGVNGGDGIPDKYQVTVKYEAINGSIISTPISEVLTIRNAAGQLVTSGTVTISGAEAESEKGDFNGWTSNNAVDLSSEDDTLSSLEINAVGGATYTFTASFGEVVSAENIHKAVVPNMIEVENIAIPEGITYPGTDNAGNVLPVIAKAGDQVTLLYAITVTGGQGDVFAVTEEVGTTFIGSTGCKLAATMSIPAQYVGTLDNTTPTTNNVTATLYFTKTFTITADTEKLTNSIVLHDDTTKEEEVPVLVPGIAVEKTVNKTSVTVGDTVKYTITVKNTGNVDLTNVNVVEAFGGDFSKITNVTGADQVTKNGFVIRELKAGSDPVEITFSYKTTKRETLTNSVVVEGTYEPGKTVENEAKSPDVTVKSEPITPVGPSKPQLNYEDHYAYVVGYPDGLVHPERNITRAEVATIFFRMLLDESREYFWAQENDFSDVAETDWFNNAVSTLANAQLINGYPDGSYRPNANITRAEFATIAIRFFLDEDVEIEENNLSDVKGHWAEANINLAYALELINGYPDGTFRPDQKITRAEAMAIVNRVLKRAPEKDHLLKDMIEWPDNLNTAAWYYADVQEATNSHKFHMDKEEEYEIWTELLPVRDWVALEQEWSKANSSKNPGEVVDIKITTPEAGDNGLKLD